MNHKNNGDFYRFVLAAGVVLPGHFHQKCITIHQISYRQVESPLVQWEGTFGGWAISGSRRSPLAAFLFLFSFVRGPTSNWGFIPCF